MAIHFLNNFSEIESDIPKLKKLVKIIGERFKLGKANINIMIVGDKEIRKINNKFLGHNRITDCISFDLSQGAEKSFDIVINAELAAREGKKRKHTNLAELALYITHGLLHNVGFDDLKETAAEKMHKEEDKILQKAGFGIIYKS